jgi:phosphate transport system ATP-binding protein
MNDTIHQSTATTIKTSSGQPLLHVEKLFAWYNDFAAVRNVTLDVKPNEVVALIGPSGCGKSTFIRCLNRLHEETPGARVEGRVQLAGTDMYGRRVDPVAIRGHVGMVFQKPNPFPAMTIFDNVAAGLLLRGSTRRSELRDIVEDSLRKAALWDEVKDKLKAPGLSLSGGQQQRLCIARTLAVKPKLILMDEPTSALDPISTAKIEELITELKQFTTIVIVTHNMQQASRVSDRTGFFLLGELVEFGTTNQIFNRPKDDRTDQYISGRFG